MTNLQRRLAEDRRRREKRKRIKVALTTIMSKMRIAGSILLLIFMVAVVTGGFTMAWFTAESPVTSAARMVTGTVGFDITETGVVSPLYEEGDEIFWVPGESKEFSWRLKNTGSKTIMLRARPVVTVRPKDDTAWGDGTRFTEQGNWATYFPYQVGDAEKSVVLLAGQTNPVGTVAVWTEGGNLFVRYKTSSGWHMKKSHLAVATSLHLIPTVASGNPAPGLFEFYHKPDEMFDEYTFVIPLEARNWFDDSLLYIAAHAEVYGPAELAGDITWTQSDCDYSWAKGEAETANGDEVFWWYFCQAVPAEEEINLCLTGTLPAGADSGIYTVHLEAEAIQASNEAPHEEWPGSPCSQP